MHQKAVDDQNYTYSSFWSVRIVSIEGLLKLIKLDKVGQLRQLKRLLSRVVLITMSNLIVPSSQTLTPSRRRRPKDNLYPVFLVVCGFFGLIQFFDPFATFEGSPGHSSENASASISLALARSKVRNHAEKFRQRKERGYPQRIPSSVTEQAFRQSDGIKTGAVNATTSHEWRRKWDQLKVGREPLFQMLFEDAKMGVDSVSLPSLEALPTTDALRQLYGDRVIVRGLETCQKYRDTVALEDRYVAVAGTFNVGTNLLAFHLENNLRFPNRTDAGSGRKAHWRWQVRWGKHQPATVRNQNVARGFEADNIDHVLPIIMIRDPLFVLQSLCAHPYGARWRHVDGHCPNLVPNEVDRAYFKGVPDIFKVTIVYDKSRQTRHNSLIHFWNEWYREYLDQFDYPALWVRFEDLVYNPQAMLQQIAACIGGAAPTRQNFQYLTKTAKSHGSGTNMLKALTKTGDAAARVRNMTIADLDYLRDHADHQLLQLFGYRIPNPGR
jgi:hypothetical protein